MNIKPTNFDSGRLCFPPLEKKMHQTPGYARDTTLRVTVLSCASSSFPVESWGQEQESV